MNALRKTLIHSSIARCFSRGKDKMILRFILVLAMLFCSIVAEMTKRKFLSDSWIMQV